MADPTDYERGYSFTDWQTSNPSRPLPGPNLDVELDDIAEATEEIVDAIKDVRRSDGALKNGIVTIDSLAPDALAELAPVSTVVRQLTSRATLVAMKDVFSEGTIAQVGNEQWIKDGGTAITDMQGWSPNNGHFVTPYHFTSMLPKDSKAQADNTSNDWVPAFQEMADYMVASNITEVRLRSGYHRMASGTVYFDEGSVQFIGSSQQNCILYICHMGTGVWFRNRSVRLEYVYALGDDARSTDLIEAAEDFLPDCVGWRFEPEDTGDFDTTTRVRDLTMLNVRSEGHHKGALLVGPITGRSQNAIINNNGLGWEFGKGNSTDRVDQQGTPIFEISGGQMSDNIIHGLAAGYMDFTHSSPVVRLVINNVDAVAGNATTVIPGLKMANAQIWLRGSHCAYMRSGCSRGVDDDDQPTAVIAIAGVDNKVESLRYLDGDENTPPIQYYSVGEFPSSGLRIEGVGLITGAVPPALVMVDKYPASFGLVDLATTEPTYPLVFHGARPIEYGQLAVTGPNIGAAGFNRVGALVGGLSCPPIVCGLAETVNESTTLAESASLRAWLEEGAEYQFDLDLEYDAHASADFKLNFIKPSGCTVNFGPTGAYANQLGTIVQPVFGPDDLLLGTTGTGNSLFIRIRGRITDPSAAGWFGLTFAQNTAHASNARVNLGSTLRVTRVKP
jgi:hypothetical protein